MLQKPHTLVAKKILVIFLAILVITGVFLVFKILRTEKNQGKVMNIVNYGSSQDHANISSNTNKQDPPEPLPQKFSTHVPFTPQAPTANWDELHNEACEEASAVMVNAFFNSSSYEISTSLLLPPQEVEKEIDKLTRWQKQNLGYYLSITTEETAKMIEANFQLTAVVAPLDKEEMKKALAKGSLIILPASGQQLKNPYFKPPGPIYHMLVVTGFDGDTFITNDPGTKRGLNYSYSYGTLENATGSWVHFKNEVNLTEKKIIIISKK